MPRLERVVMVEAAHHVGHCWDRGQHGILCDRDFNGPPSLSAGSGEDERALRADGRTGRRRLRMRS